jgi:hypothetical protein
MKNWELPDGNDALGRIESMIKPALMDVISVTILFLQAQDRKRR